MKRTRAFLPWALLAGLIIAVLPATSHAFTATSRATGNWNVGSTWSITRTGTISTSVLSPTVNGVGTKFQSTPELAPGDMIMTAAGAVLGTVLSITSDTVLTLNANAASTNANIAYTAQKVPLATDAAIIAAANTVTLTAAATALTLTVNAPTAANGVTLNGNTLNVGVSPLFVGAVTLTLPAAAFTSTINVGSGTLNAGVITINGGAAANLIALVTVSTGTINATSVTFAGTAAQARFTSTGASTVNLTGNFGSGGTLTAGAGNGTINFNGSAAQNIGVYATYNNIAINNTAAAPTTVSFLGNATLAGTLSVNTGILTTAAGTLTLNGATTVASGARFNVAGTTLAANSTTSVSGNLNITSVTGTKTFTGGVTINNGGILAESVAEPIAYGGNVTINNGGTLTEFGAATMSFAGNLRNDGTYTASTGVHTFSGAGKTLSGANAISIPSATFTGSYQNIKTLTVSTTLAGVGSLTNGDGTNGTLNIGGTSAITTLTASAANNTVNYNGVAQTVKLVGGTTYFNLSLGNSGVKTIGSVLGQTLTVAGALTVASGVTYAGNTFNPAVNVTGNITNSGTVTAGTGVYTVGGNLTNNGTGTVTTGTGAFSLAGDFSNAGTFTTGTGAIRFNGGAPQTLSDTSAAVTTTFTNLTMINTGSSPWLTINKSITVNTTLTFTSGGITTGANSVILPAAGAVVRVSGHVVGNLQKNVAISGVPISRTFEIGDATTYAPINPVTFATVGTAGNLTASTTTGDHPNTSTAPATSGLDANNSVNRYWTMTNSGIVFSTYSATFNYAPGPAPPSDNDASAVPANYIVAKGDTCSGSGAGRTCTTWTVPTQGAHSSSQSTATGMNSFSDFAIGQRAVNNILVSVSASPVNTCTATGVTITARDSSNATITNYLGTVNLSTSVNRGDWTATASAHGTLTPGSADSGAAIYTFVAADNGSITLNLTDAHADSLTITVTDSVTATSGTSGTLTFQGNTFFIANDAIQVAGRNQSMTVQLNGAAGCTNPLSGYAGSKNLKAWYTRDADDPGGTAPSVVGMASPPLGTSVPAASNLTLAFTAGSASFSLSTVDVGKYVINLRDDDHTFQTSDINGSSPTITTRPFALAFTNIKQGATANQGGTSAGGFKFIAAEDTFQATVGGYLWQAADDSDNDGVPDSGANVTDNGLTPKFSWATTLSAAAPFTPAGGSLGTLGGTVSIAAGSYVGGAATVSDLTYNQVGSMTLSAAVSNYLNSGISLSATSTPVGRFYPDHFTMTASALSAACNGFTYMDQPAMNIGFTLQARGKITNAPLSNYDNDTLGYPAVAASLAAENNDAGTDLGPRITSTVATFKWTAGALTASSPASTFARNATPDGAYDLLAIGATAVDADGAVIANRDMNAAVSGDCVVAANCDARQIGAATKVRFGRLRLYNVSGGNRVDLPVPIEAQYWGTIGGNTGWSTNLLDNCTAILNTDVRLFNWEPAATFPPPDPCNTRVVLAAGTMSGGRYPNSNLLRMRAPGGALRGGVNLTVNLNSVSGNTCIGANQQAATNAAKPWLQGAWGTATYNQDPAARVTFGTYTNTNQLIYHRENY